MTVAQPVAGDGVSIFAFAPGEAEPPRGARADLQYLRASGLAQARLQLAVLSGNRRRALEQIDRLVTIDRQLERLAEGGGAPAGGPDELAAELAEQRLAIASEKLALTSEIALPRLAPAFGAGVTSIVAGEADIEIVEHETLRSRLLHILLWAAGFLVLCLGVAAAAVMQL